VVWINFISFRFISIKLLVFFFNPGEGVEFSAKQSTTVIKFNFANLTFISVVILSDLFGLESIWSSRMD